VDRQESGTAAYFREEQTALACKPWVVDGAASVDDRRIAVGHELVLQARRKRTHSQRHPDHVPCLESLVAKQLPFPGDARKVDVPALAAIAHYCLHAEKALLAVEQVSLAGACARLKSAPARRCRSLASLPLSPRRDSSVAWVRAQLVAVPFRNIRRTGHHRCRPDALRVPELLRQRWAWRSSWV
jgi:hypothetical protein